MLSVIPKPARIACALFALAACGDGGSNGGGGGITEPTTGSVRVTVTTTGRVPDRDGYTLTVAGTPAVVPANYTFIVPGLAPGAHTVTLAGIAENCQATESTTQTVQVVAGDAALVQLTVQCAANRLAYVATVDGRNTVFTQRLDGTRRTPLAAGVSARIGWSPDGHHIAYVMPGETERTRVIRIADVDSATSRTLAIAGIFTVAHPEWSPDGTRIAFAGNPSGGVRAIYTVRAADGGDLKLLTPDAGEKTVPAWSPDGGRMAYLRVLGPAQELWVMKADGTERQMLSSFRDGGYNHVDWSPDGTRLVFSKLENGQWDLFTIRPDGTGEAPLTRTADVSERYAAYLPDGRIGFNVSPPGVAPLDYDIWIINADGTGAANATGTPGFSETVPAWQ